MAKASEKAHDLIRDMILSGKLAPGEQLSEEALAERCGVSRTPVRDALRRLEAELLVRRNDSQRCFVADWSIDDVADAFALRAMLEGYAARRAAERMDSVTLKRLRDCNKALFSAVRGTKSNVEMFLDRNREFHAIILETAGSRRLASLLSTLIEQPVVWRTAQHYGRDSFQRSHSEHDDLLSAFARKDGAWAQSVMEGHIHRAFHAYADAHHGLAAMDRGAA